MSKVNLIRRLVCAFVITIALGAANTALADPILPGFDLFHTLPNTFHIIPGIGFVPFMGGTPLIPGTNTDTIVERLQGIDPFPVGGTGTIDIILRELSLQSVAPVNIGGNLFDISATAAPLQALGSMTVVHSTVDGGVFTSTLPVNVLLTFTPVGGGAPFSTSFSTTLMSTCVWSHTPPPNYPTPPQFPSGGFFVVGPCVEISPTQDEVHVVGPASVPEPTAMLLLASGLVGIAGLGRKRISRKKSPNCK
jgi:PEP-CTERM motif